jgi:diaminohydroxyphosphoribosylaminopyrimidine deaminase / 5-amino-6-(5-phosphoribosylamino)uracil reductase
MLRCLDLARLAAGYVAPNPMVGAVLVHEDRIIGEGYHRQYGQAHAEVNCVAAVKPADRSLVPASTLYVSLEPCAHHGKTPPCADLIIRESIPRVVVGCRDPFPQVDGKGIERLKAAGVDVGLGLLEKECRELNKRFFCFHTRHRPYIVLKWAQSANAKIAGQSDRSDDGAGRLHVSNEYSNRLVHKWRSEEASILVGTNTALSDDPALTTKLWSGPNPIRMVIDRELRLPRSLQLFDGKTRTIVFNELKHEMAGSLHAIAGSLQAVASPQHNLLYYQLATNSKLATDSSLVHQLVMALYSEKIISVMVEGGATLLQSFIDEGYWDETRVITNEELVIPGGLSAPVLNEATLVSRETLFSDRIAIYHNPRIDDPAAE